jgi:hypothetical protein
MTAFAHTSYPKEHPGVARAVNTTRNLMNLIKQVDSAKSIAVILLSAMVSTLLVVVNQVIDTYTDGHLMAVWMLMWVVAFGSLALLATPVRQFVYGVRPFLKTWHQKRLERMNDEKIWAVALQDPRVMAEIQRALSQQ